MKIRFPALVVLVALAAPICLAAPAAVADDSGARGWSAGKLRLELAGWTSLRSGRRSRTGDYGTNVSIAYEVPVTEHLTLGIKGYPFFFYDQADAGEDTILGVGLGPEFRVYQKKGYRGLFGEVGIAVLATSGKFDGNSGTFNFFPQGGVGYKFKSDWHVVARLQHISNSGLAAHNSGVNMATLGFGYTFKRGAQRRRPAPRSLHDAGD